MRSLALALLATLLTAVLGACAGPTSATEWSDGHRGKPCLGVDHLGALRVLSCIEAVAVAESSLPSHAPIVKIEFLRAGSIDGPECAGAPVPCPFPQEGTVYFEFATGDPMSVHVGLDDKGVPVPSTWQVQRVNDVFGGPA